MHKNFDIRLLIDHHSAMRKNQKGFSAIELVIVLVVVCLLTITGWYVYQARHKTNQNSIPNGWLTFKSADSNIKFSYPPSWHLKKLPATQSNSTLESVEIDGSNGFSMEYVLETRPTGPDVADCMVFHQTTIPIDSQYLMALKTLSNSASISLQNVDQNSLVGHNCQTYNLVSSNIVFTFEGQYQYGSKYAHTTSQSTYLNLPEVRAAKMIFASFQLGTNTSSNSSNPATTQCGCQEGNSCADISACEGPTTSSKP